VNRAEAERIALLTQLSGRRDAAELAYAAYLGFVLRRRRSPDAERVWTLVRDFMVETLEGEPAKAAERRGKG
jgi:hypothetical protein